MDDVPTASALLSYEAACADPATAMVRWYDVARALYLAAIENELTDEQARKLKDRERDCYRRAGRVKVAPGPRRPVYDGAGYHVAWSDGSPAMVEEITRLTEAA